jgi:hypothetical protein
MRKRNHEHAKSVFLYTAFSRDILSTTGHCGGVKRCSLRPTVYIVTYVTAPRFYPLCTAAPPSIHLQHEYIMSIHISPVADCCEYQNSVIFCASFLSCTGVCRQPTESSAVLFCDPQELQKGLVDNFK